MDDSLLVGGLERVCHLPRDVECIPDWKAGSLRPTARDTLAERLAVDQFKHQCTHRRAGFTRPVFDAVDRGDVWMIQCGQDARFAFEARESIRIGRELARQNLDRNVTSQPRIARAVDLAL